MFVITENIMERPVYVKNVEFSESKAVISL